MEYDSAIKGSELLMDTCNDVAESQNVMLKERRHRGTFCSYQSGSSQETGTTQEFEGRMFNIQNY